MVSHGIALRQKSISLHCFVWNFFECKNCKFERNFPFSVVTKPFCWFHLLINGACTCQAGYCVSTRWFCMFKQCVGKLQYSIHTVYWIHTVKLFVRYGFQKKDHTIYLMYWLANSGHAVSNSADVCNMERQRSNNMLVLWEDVNAISWMHNTGYWILFATQIYPIEKSVGLLVCLGTVCDIDLEKKGFVHCSSLLCPFFTRSCVVSVQFIRNL